MPSSVRFVLWLLGLATLVAAVALTVLYRQDQDRARTTAEQLARGNVDAGKDAMRRYGCGSCHRIRGVAGAAGRVGPSLDGIAVRTTIAGRLANRPDNLIRWILHPQQVDPGNGMPDQPMPEQDARDMAAYLYTLRSDE